MNVLTKHNAILSKFSQELKQKHVLLKSLEPFIDDIDVKSMADVCREEIKSQCGLQIYVADVCHLINEYKTILNTPLGSQKCKLSERKAHIERVYCAIVQRLIKSKEWDDKFIDAKQDKVSTCTVCSNSDYTLFETDDVGRKTCLACSSELQTLETGNTSLDYNRATVTGKFIYNRVLHFKDCIKQFQGKQNCKIPDKIYSDLDAKFVAYRLLVDSPNPQVRYSKISKQHILLFLRELKYVKHYENVNVIYSVLTGKKVDDIDHLEKQLVDDFKQLVLQYDSLHSKDKPEELDRKNFLNVQYLLFQLLRRHGYECKIEDFSVLKTTDRKQFHDKICCNLFQQLGWNFTPVF